MRLTFLITIDPVKGLPLLNFLLHSLNLQTGRNFDVVFYNQTLLSESDVFAQLRVRPEFNYRFFSIERQQFLGNYPLWDLYALHQRLLEGDLLGDYFMSMHMEEFLDVDYVDNVTKVLEASGLDILLANLCRTGVDGAKIADILETQTADAFADYLDACRLKRAPHWSFLPFPASLRGKLKVLKWNFGKILNFDFRRRLIPTQTGYNRLRVYYEDLYFMSRAFARRYDWFLSGHSMYFEDVHLCNVPGVCELGREIAKLTPFPAYFNLSKIYHLNHSKFYYQLDDPGFTEALLALKTDDLLLRTLQDAVRMYQDGSLTKQEALRYTRRNPQGTGTQNLNFKYHIEAVRAARNGKPACTEPRK
jgi:hypothetical protein